MTTTLLTTTPLTAERLAETEALCERMQSWEDGDDAREDRVCVKCGEPNPLSAPELELSPLCDCCAQDIAEWLPDLLAEIRRLRAGIRSAATTCSDLGDDVSGYGMARTLEALLSPESR